MVDDPVERAQRWIEEQKETMELRRAKQNAVKIIGDMTGEVVQLENQVNALVPYKEYVEDITPITQLEGYFCNFQKLPASKKLQIQKKLQ